MKILGPLAEEGKINPDASIRDSQSIIINAPIDTVWQVISNISEWSDWNPSIKSVKVNQVEVGGSFSWNISGTTIKSVIRKIQDKELISWTGTALGIKAIQVWKLEADGDQTIVTTEESMEGFFTLFFSHQKLHNSLVQWLENLKQRAEK